jgi:hypothetical protein
MRIILSGYLVLAAVALIFGTTAPARAQESIEILFNVGVELNDLHEDILTWRVQCNACVSPGVCNPDDRGYSRKWVMD